MKKFVIRTLLVAAALCAVSVTVFAAGGGLDYIKRIFGDSAGSIQHEIATPGITAAADGRELAVEAMVTDGYVTNIVVSLTGSTPDSFQLFQVEGDVDMDTISYYSLDELSTKGRTYYVVGFTNNSRFDRADVTLSLNEDVAPIDLSFQLDNRLGNAVVQFPQDARSGQVFLGELQISPMGFLLVGKEEEARGGLPSTAISLVFADGSTEELEVEFDDSDETVGGGGGAVMAADPRQAPLVVTFQGTRNPDGEIVITGQFSRVINAEAVEKVVIQGREYFVGK